MLVMGLIGLIVLLILCAEDTEKKNKNLQNRLTQVAVQNYSGIYYNVRNMFTTYGPVVEENVTERNEAYFAVSPFSTIDGRNIVSYVMFSNQGSQITIISTMTIKAFTASLSQYLNSRFPKICNSSFTFRPEQNKVEVFKYIPISNYISQEDIINSWFHQVTTLQGIVSSAVETGVYYRESSPAMNTYDNDNDNNNYDNRSIDERTHDYVNDYIKKNYL